MARSVAWRRTVSDACCWHQTQALESTLYILRQTGPTGFLLKEEGETKNVKVFLGDPHSCTCSVFRKEKDLCKHICWLLLRKFRLSANDPLSWQLGLVERELNEVLQGRNTAARQVETKQKPNDHKDVQTSDGRAIVEQRDIAPEDVCPICQEELLVKKHPVTFCKFGCGNSIHIKCMQVWAEHQQKSSQDGVIKCPMCREDFGPLDLLKTEMRNAGCSKPPAPGLRLDRHVGIACGHCNMAPIEGKCYRCSVCPTYYMCQRCFNLPVHTNHAFQFRQKCNQKWKSALRTLGSSLPPAIVNDLVHREITENDYDMLLQLERNSENTELSNLTEETIQALPLEKVREGGPLLALGSQCRVCLRGFSLGQLVRRLPCKHKFHKDCIDSWLLHSHPTCPIDGLSAAPIVNTESDIHISENNSEDMHGVLSTNQTGLVLTAFGIPLAASRVSETSANSRLKVQRNNATKYQLTPSLNSNVQLQLLGQQFTSPSSLVGHNRNSLLRETSTSNQQRVTAKHKTNSEGLREQVGYFNSEINLNEQLTGQHLINLLQNHSAGSTYRVSELRRLSASSMASVESDTREGRGQLRSLKRRPRSIERQGPSIRDVRRVQGELYLGNNPLLQPPITENLAVRKPPLPDKTRSRLFKPTLWKRLPPLNTSLAHAQADMKLEGSALDNSSVELSDIHED
ncbi:E3 ubiquitin-protein ligase Zswim2-like isoform X2 [Biomphalaria glabrata]|uniref:E3 ubiquitin-protein ligase Zswim2-like isoform X2 n=1 Tax=Biomphalaria glabrata TaxID=6526 RepID=A0A9W3BNL9_BIOGL|nr:E3 ubiquitin-protein ligase Zswim2-like isoform X2 [Biomphalaria glabrata]